MSHAVTFDTLAYANKLKAIGVPDKHAEAQAQLQAEVLSDFVSKSLATKEDLLHMQNAQNENTMRLENSIKTVDMKLTWLLYLVGLISTLVGIFKAISFLL